MTRQELINVLEMAGFLAKARDWALGQTIVVTHKALGSRHGGILIYKDAVHLLKEEGSWVAVSTNSLVECRDGPFLDEFNGALELVTYLRKRFTLTYRSSRLD